MATTNKSICAKALNFFAGIDNAENSTLALLDARRASKRRYCISDARSWASTLFNDNGKRFDFACRSAAYFASVAPASCHVLQASIKDNCLTVIFTDKSRAYVRFNGAYIQVSYSRRSDYLTRYVVGTFAVAHTTYRTGNVRPYLKRIF